MISVGIVELCVYRKVQGQHERACNYSAVPYVCAVASDHLSASYLLGLPTLWHLLKLLGRHLADLRDGLHRVHESNAWLVSEHVIEGLLAIDQLQLVELHVLRRLLQVSLPLHDLILQLFNQRGILGSTRSSLIHSLYLHEFLVEIAIFLVH